MNKMPRVLIVEDEPKIAQVLADFLAADGFNTHILYDGGEVTDYVASQAPDFILLDIMLPNKDGLTICKEVRQFSEVPILMLTARVDEIDRLMGLGFGADDYVCKPFSAREVVARVKAILKRVHQSKQTNQLKVFSYQGLHLDPQRFLCLVNEIKIELTPVEFNLLQTLMSRPGQVFSRSILMDNSYKDARIVSNRTIDSHMKNLRSKITAHHHKDLIHTIYGIGYKLE